MSPSPFCRLCEVSDDSTWREGRLALAFDNVEETAPLQHHLASYGLTAETTGNLVVLELENDTASIALEHFRLRESVDGVHYALLSPEQPLDTFPEQLAPLQVAIDRWDSAWIKPLLNQGRIVTHFQPIVRCGAPDSVFAHECLMRGISEDGQLVSPATLLAAARATGTLFHLDRLARTTAIRMAAAANVEGTIFINFNPNSIYNPEHCLRTTIQAVQESRLEPSRVVFEIVESEIIADFPRFRRIADFYRREGFRLAVDDLGAGYSDLNRVSELQPEFVKLDMDLTRNIHSDPSRQLVVGQILEIAADLGMKTIVEGIESAEEHAFLQAAGADYAQGYLFGRPAALV